ncbi:hypothetical protein BaRGS_00016859 [Batillaria attramentaria]|uniref:Uncharacterized protein n=1 Tax=Batillaria attramentaria TaxID=370345 RepID=A0ABD0KXD7_9CAEN
MKSWTVLASAVLVLSIIHNCEAAVVIDLEAEHGDGFDARNAHWRSNAWGKKAVWLRDDGDYLTIHICVPRKTEVAVEQIWFSNDGWKKTAVIYIDGIKIGDFNTTDNSYFGFSWNTFRYAGPYGVVPFLAPGRHTIDVVMWKSMSMDPWGIEIDQVKLWCGTDFTKEELMCKDDEDITGRNVTPKDKDKYREKENKTEKPSIRFVGNRTAGGSTPGSADSPSSTPYSGSTTSPEDSTKTDGTISCTGTDCPLASTVSFPGDSTASQSSPSSGVTGTGVKDGSVSVPGEEPPGCTGKECETQPGGGDYTQKTGSSTTLPPGFTIGGHSSFPGTSEKASSGPDDNQNQPLESSTPETPNATTRKEGQTQPGETGYSRQPGSSTDLPTDVGITGSGSLPDTTKRPASGKTDNQNQPLESSTPETPNVPTTKEGQTQPGETGYSREPGSSTDLPTDVGITGSGSPPGTTKRPVSGQTDNQNQPLDSSTPETPNAPTTKEGQTQPGETVYSREPGSSTNLPTDVGITGSGSLPGTTKRPASGKTDNQNQPLDSSTPETPNVPTTKEGQTQPGETGYSRQPGSSTNLPTDVGITGSGSLPDTTKRPVSGQTDNQNQPLESSTPETPNAPTTKEGQTQPGETGYSREPGSSTNLPTDVGITGSGSPPGTTKRPVSGQTDNQNQPLDSSTPETPNAPTTKEGQTQPGETGYSREPGSSTDLPTDVGITGSGSLPDTTKRPVSGQTDNQNQPLDSSTPETPNAPTTKEGQTQPGETVYSREPGSSTNLPTDVGITGSGSPPGTTKRPVSGQTDNQNQPLDSSTPETPNVPTTKEGQTQPGETGYSREPGSSTDLPTDVGITGSGSLPDTTKRPVSGQTDNQNQPLDSSTPETPNAPTTKEGQTQPGETGYSREPGSSTDLPTDVGITGSGSLPDTTKRPAPGQDGTQGQSEVSTPGASDVTGASGENPNTTSPDGSSLSQTPSSGSTEYPYDCQGNDCSRSPDGNVEVTTPKYDTATGPDKDSTPHKPTEKKPKRCRGKKGQDETDGDCQDTDTTTSPGSTNSYPSDGTSTGKVKPQDSSSPTDTTSTSTSPGNSKPSDTSISPEGSKSPTKEYLDSSVYDRTTTSTGVSNAEETSSPAGYVVTGDTTSTSTSPGNSRPSDTSTSPEGGKSSSTKEYPDSSVYDRTTTSSGVSNAEETSSPAGYVVTGDTTSTSTSPGNSRPSDTSTSPEGSKSPSTKEYPDSSVYDRTTTSSGVSNAEETSSPAGYVVTGDTTSTSTSPGNSKPSDTSTSPEGSKSPSTKEYPDSSVYGRTTTSPGVSKSGETSSRAGYVVTDDTSGSPSGVTSGNVTSSPDNKTYTDGTGCQGKECVTLKPHGRGNPTPPQKGRDSTDNTGGTSVDTAKTTTEGTSQSPYNTNPDGTSVSSGDTTYGTSVPRSGTTPEENYNCKGKDCSTPSPGKGEGNTKPSKSTGAPGDSSASPGDSTAKDTTVSPYDSTSDGLTRFPGDTTSSERYGCTGEDCTIAKPDEGRKVDKPGETTRPSSGTSPYPGDSTPTRSAGDTTAPEGYDCTGEDCTTARPEEGTKGNKPGETTGSSSDTSAYPGDSTATRPSGDTMASQGYECTGEDCTTARSEEGTKGYKPGEITGSSSDTPVYPSDSTAIKGNKPGETTGSSSDTSSYPNDSTATRSPGDRTPSEEYGCTGEDCTTARPGEGTKTNKPGETTGSSSDTSSYPNDSTATRSPGDKTPSAGYSCTGKGCTTGRPEEDTKDNKPGETTGSSSDRSVYPSDSTSVKGNKPGETTGSSSDTSSYPNDSTATRSPGDRTPSEEYGCTGEDCTTARPGEGTKSNKPGETTGSSSDTSVYPSDSTATRSPDENTSSEGYECTGEDCNTSSPEEGTKGNKPGESTRSSSDTPVYPSDSSATRAPGNKTSSKSYDCTGNDCITVKPEEGTKGSKPGETTGSLPDTSTYPSDSTATPSPGGKTPTEGYDCAGEDCTTPMPEEGTKGNKPGKTTGSSSDTSSYPSDSTATPSPGGKTPTEGYDCAGEDCTTPRPEEGTKGNKPGKTTGSSSDTSSYPSDSTATPSPGGKTPTEGYDCAGEDCTTPSPEEGTKGNKPGETTGSSSDTSSYPSDSSATPSPGGKTPTEGYDCAGEDCTTPRPEEGTKGNKPGETTGSSSDTSSYPSDSSATPSPGGKTPTEGYDCTGEDCTTPRPEEGTKGNKPGETTGSSSDTSSYPSDSTATPSPGGKTPTEGYDCTGEDCTTPSPEEGTKGNKPGETTGSSSDTSSYPSDSTATRSPGDKTSTEGYDCTGKDCPTPKRGDKPEQTTGSSSPSSGIKDKNTTSSSGESVTVSYNNQPSTDSPDCKGQECGTIKPGGRANPTPKVGQNTTQEGTTDNPSESSASAGRTTSKGTPQSPYDSNDTGAPNDTTAYGSTESPGNTKPGDSSSSPTDTRTNDGSRAPKETSGSPYDSTSGDVTKSPGTKPGEQSASPKDTTADSTPASPTDQKYEVTSASPSDSTAKPGDFSDFPKDTSPQGTSGSPYGSTSEGVTKSPYDTKPGESSASVSPHDRSEGTPASIETSSSAFTRSDDTSSVVPCTGYNCPTSNPETLVSETPTTDEKFTNVPKTDDTSSADYYDKTPSRKPGGTEGETTSDNGQNTSGQETATDMATLPPEVTSVDCQEKDCETEKPGARANPTPSSGIGVTEPGRLSSTPASSTVECTGIDCETQSPDRGDGERTPEQGLTYGPSSVGTGGITTAYPGAPSGSTECTGLGCETRSPDQGEGETTSLPGHTYEPSPKQPGQPGFSTEYPGAPSRSTECTGLGCETRSPTQTGEARSETDQTYGPSSVRSEDVSTQYPGIPTGSDSTDCTGVGCETRIPGQREEKTTSEPGQSYGPSSGRPGDASTQYPGTVSGSDATECKGVGCETSSPDQREGKTSESGQSQGTSSTQYPGVTSGSDATNCIGVDCQTRPDQGEGETSGPGQSQGPSSIGPVVPGMSTENPAASSGFATTECVGTDCEAQNPKQTGGEATQEPAYTTGPGDLDISTAPSGARPPIILERFSFGCPQPGRITVVKNSYYACYEGEYRFDVYGSDVTTYFLNVAMPRPHSYPSHSWRGRRSAGGDSKSHNSNDGKKHKVLLSVGNNNPDSVGSVCRNNEELIELNDVNSFANIQRLNESLPARLRPQDLPFFTLRFNMSGARNTISKLKQASFTFAMMTSCCQAKNTAVDVEVQDLQTGQIVIKRQNKISYKDSSSSGMLEVNIPSTVQAIQIKLNLADNTDAFVLNHMALGLDYLSSKGFNPTQELDDITNRWVGKGNKRYVLHSQENVRVEGVSAPGAKKMRVKTNGKDTSASRLLISGMMSGAYKPRVIFDQTSRCYFYSEEDPDKQTSFVLGPRDPEDDSPHGDVDEVEISYPSDSHVMMDITSHKHGKRSLLFAVSSTMTTVMITKLSEPPSPMTSRVPVCGVLLPCSDYQLDTEALIRADDTEGVKSTDAWRTITGNTVEMERPVKD